MACEAVRRGEISNEARLVCQRGTLRLEKCLVVFGVETRRFWHEDVSVLLKSKAIIAVR